MYLILLLAVFALTGVFSYQNDGHQVFTLLGYTWALPTWAPTAIGVGAVSVLLLLRMSHASLGSRFLEMSYGRELDKQQDTIQRLLAENGDLREQLATLKGEARGEARATPSGPRRSWLDEVRELPSRIGAGDRSPT